MTGSALKDAVASTIEVPSADDDPWHQTQEPPPPPPRKPRQRAPDPSGQGALTQDESAQQPRRRHWLIRVVAVALVLTLLGPLVLVGIIAGPFAKAGFGTASGGQSSSAPAAVAGIPGDYLALYQAAAARFGIQWELLAAVGKVECDHGRLDSPACLQNGAENYAGAGGPMQFLAATWAGNGTAPGYGEDGDGDGDEDRWDPADAIFGAAHYLRTSGAPNDLRAALWAYNHSTDYADLVLGWMERYRDAAASAPSTSVPQGAPAELAQAVLTSARIELRPEAKGDIRAGVVDAHLLAALLSLSQGFRLAGVGPFRTGHPYNVAGTQNASNHSFGRAVDIGTVDGEIVSPSSPASRRLAIAAGTLPSAIRPTEIGSPFAGLPVPGAFTDADHQDHLHLGFDSTS